MMPDIRCEKCGCKSVEAVDYGRLLCRKCEAEWIKYYRTHGCIRDKFMEWFNIDMPIKVILT